MPENLFRPWAPRPIRSLPNKWDTSTVVSIYPLRIEEHKWTLEPGVFVLEPGTKDNPFTLKVMSSSWWRNIHEDKSILEIPTGSALVAESIVRDFCNSIDSYNAEIMGPGLFFIPGEALNSEEVKRKYPEQIAIADQRQRAWYAKLVEDADMHWSNSNGNPRSVSTLAKMAAQQIQVTGKPWQANEIHRQLSNCPACGTLRNGNFPVCASCGTIVDLEAYNKAGFVSIGKQKAAV